MGKYVLEKVLSHAVLHRCATEAVAHMPTRSWGSHLPIYLLQKDLKVEDTRAGVAKKCQQGKLTAPGCGEGFPEGLLAHDHGEAPAGLVFGESCSPKMTASPYPHTEWGVIRADNTNEGVLKGAHLAGSGSGSTFSFFL